MGDMAPSIVKGKYEDIPEHANIYNRDNWINKKVWYKKTRPRVLSRSWKDGKLTDPYTGEQIKKNPEVDHTVALKEANESQDPERTLSPIEKKRFGHYTPNLKVLSKKTNREKSYYDIVNWLPKLNKSNFAKHTETVKNKWGLAMDPEEASKFKEITGRETTTRVSPKLKNTFYCMRCHVKHSIANHN
tara:strand:- start:33 stop:596 length:564 start_codon:yes stop_codon:yes gene_type:complete